MVLFDKKLFWSDLENWEEFPDKICNVGGMLWYGMVSGALTGRGSEGRIAKCGLQTNGM